MPWDILLANLIKLDTASLLFKRRENMVNRQRTEGCEFMSLKMQIRMKGRLRRQHLAVSMFIYIISNRRRSSSTCG